MKAANFPPLFPFLLSLIPPFYFSLAGQKWNGLRSRHLDSKSSTTNGVTLARSLNLPIFLSHKTEEIPVWWLLGRKIRSICKNAMLLPGLVLVGDTSLSFLSSLSSYAPPASLWPASQRHSLAPVVAKGGCQVSPTPTMR